MTDKSLGDRIRSYRKQLGMTQSQLAELMGVQTGAIGTWERGEFVPKLDAINKMADIFNISYIELISGDTISSPAMQNDTVHTVMPISQDFSEVPVVDMRACAGLGIAQSFDDIEVERTMMLPASLVGPISYDSARKPFAVHIDGDSMSEAGLYDGMLAVVNPCADVYSGDSALVCFGERDDVAIKRVYFHQDGGVEIRSASPGYPVHKYSRQDCLPVGDMPPKFRILGKVMGAWSVPKRG